jgi:hypothetical protein
MAKQFLHKTLILTHCTHRSVHQDAECTYFDPTSPQTLLRIPLQAHPGEPELSKLY